MSTNPNNAVGTNAAYGGRTSVKAFNDNIGAYSRGILSGWACSPSSGMTVSLGGNGTTRDIAIAEDVSGNKITINNISESPISVTMSAAPSSNSRIDLIVAYVDNPPQGSDTVLDNPAACGLITISGTAAANPVAPTESAIRTAITADGASGSTAYYVVLATITIASGTTDLTSSNISAGDNARIGSLNIDFTTFSKITIGASYNDSAASANSIIGLSVVRAQVGSGLTRSGNYVVVGDNISKVKVSSNVFYSSNTSGYGWMRINVNDQDAHLDAITNLAGGGYGTASISSAILSVSQGDKISLYNLEGGAKVRGTASWLTVEVVDD